MQEVTAIVLCGGRSTRMGRDKASLPFGSETMAERVERLAGEVAGRVIAVGRRDQATSTVHDAIEDQGPLAGIAAGLAASTTDINIVVACDMPLIKPAVLGRLAAMLGDHDMCVAIVDGHATVLCGAYHKRVASHAQQLLDSGERRVMGLLDRVDVRRVDAAVFRDIDPDLETFISVDTPGQYGEVSSRKPHPENSRSQR